LIITEPTLSAERGFGANRPRVEKSWPCTLTRSLVAVVPRNGYDVVVVGASDAVSLAVDFRVLRPRPNCFANPERRSLYAGATIG
jgi:hypothetical protein